MIGLTHDTISTWMKKHWIRDKQYVVVGKQTLINVKEVDKWLLKRGLQTSHNTTGN
jgi:hypothetical protein